MEGNPLPSRDMAWIFCTGTPNKSLEKQLSQALSLGVLNWVLFPMPEGMDHAQLQREAEELSMEIEEPFLL
jgi:hypothetical protein